MKCSACGQKFKWWENWVCVGPFVVLSGPVGKFYHKKCLPHGAQAQNQD
jgi:hypothetical protein